MKNMKFLTAALFISSLFIGCSKDDAPRLKKTIRSEAELDKLATRRN